MKVASSGGQTPSGATADRSRQINSDNFQDMGTWFNTLMGDSFA